MKKILILITLLVVFAGYAKASNDPDYRKEFKSHYSCRDIDHEANTASIANRFRQGEVVPDETIDEAISFVADGKGKNNFTCQNVQEDIKMHQETFELLFEDKEDFEKLIKNWLFNVRRIVSKAEKEQALYVVDFILSKVENELID